VFPMIWQHEQLLQWDDHLFVFEIPKQFVSDVLTFIKGKYSHMSAEAKDSIRLYSSLAYREEKKQGNDSSFTTDSRLLALERDPDLREHLEELLGVRISDKDELLSPPDSKEVWQEQNKEESAYVGSFFLNNIT